MSLTPAQIAALRELGEVWPGRDMVIIGATALGFYYDMGWRRTAGTGEARLFRRRSHEGGRGGLAPLGQSRLRAVAERRSVGVA